MKTDDLLAMCAARVPGAQAMVRHPDFPHERFEVVSVTRARNLADARSRPAEAEIASRWRTLTADVAVLEPWFQAPRYEALLDAARITLNLAAEAAPDYHETKLHVMAGTLEAMYRETSSKRQHEEAAAK